MIIKVSSTNGVHGDIYVSGSKNSCLPILCTALLTRDWMILENAPQIEDVFHMLAILKSIGCEVNQTGSLVKIRCRRVNSEITSELVSKIRASYYLMGAMLARKKKVKIHYPGGCDLGKRPIDFHLDAFEALGCETELKNQVIEITGKKMHFANISFAKESVGATINAVLASVKVKGVTIINNASLEPEVLDVIHLLQKMGANIIIKDDHRIIVTGVRKLSGTTYKIMFDRMEAGSYVFLAGALPNSNLTIHQVNPQVMKTVLTVARSAKLNIKVGFDSIVVKSPTVISPIQLLIGPYPFFPTDLQQVLTSFLLRADGTSTIEDTVFPGRISHIKELNKLGGNVTLSDDDSPIIKIKPSTLQGKRVKAHDLRCAMSLVIAGAMAKGDTYIEQAELLLRGYENPIGKLKGIGLMIEEVEEIN